jgi:hypothetical protein
VPSLLACRTPPFSAAPHVALLNSQDNCKRVRRLPLASHRTYLYDLCDAAWDGPPHQLYGHLLLCLLVHTQPGLALATSAQQAQHLTTRKAGGTPNMQGRCYLHCFLVLQLNPGIRVLSLLRGLSKQGASEARRIKRFMWDSTPRQNQQQGHNTRAAAADRWEKLVQTQTPASKTPDCCFCRGRRRWCAPTRRHQCATACRTAAKATNTALTVCAGAFVCCGKTSIQMSLYSACCCHPTHPAGDKIMSPLLTAVAINAAVTAAASNGCLCA